MGAMRKAGVWLGLIEEDDPSYRGASRTAVDVDEFADSDVTDGRTRRPRRADTHSTDLRSVEQRSPSSGETRESRLGGDRSGTTSAERSAERSDARSAIRHLNRTGVTPLREEVPHSAPEPARPPVSIPAAQSVKSTDAKSGYRITTLHPTTYNEARTIGERYRDGTPVIMNLSEMDEADAKRLVDFAAGLVFGLRGSFERVTNRVFLLSPANVRVTAEDKAKIAEGGFLGQL